MNLTSEPNIIIIYQSDLYTKSGIVLYTERHDIYACFTNDKNKHAIVIAVEY